jgi:hypothetical protein
MYIFHSLVNLIVIKSRVYLVSYIGKEKNNLKNTINFILILIFAHTHNEIYDAILMPIYQQVWKWKNVIRTTVETSIGEY